MIMIQVSRRGRSLKTALALTAVLVVAIGASGPAGRADKLQGAGIRSSTYGRPNDPGPGYWARTGTEIAAKFPGAKPEAIWIVSRLKGRGTEMSFPVPPGGDPLITGMGEDLSEPVLQLFDKLGYRVWLQTEPGWAPVDKAFHVMLDRYGRHKCVIGVGVDIEWHRSNNPDLGDPVTDEMARTWLAAARSHNPAYRMFLKHFREDVMPPTFRDGVLFVDDSQIFKSSDEMIEEFAKWGRTFAPSPVAFQYGYPSDKPWWSLMKDPVKEIGDRILAATPNTEALIWVDFSVRDVFPPDASKGDLVPTKK
jgi:hypothetical protein